MITEIGTNKISKLSVDEQAIVKRAGDAMQSVLSYFSEAYVSDGLSREITEEMEKFEELEADPQFFLKDRLNEMEEQMFQANNSISIEKQR